MNKWVAVAVLVLCAGVASAQMPPGAEEYKTGEEAIKKGDMDVAITSFEAALAANPDLFASHYYLGWAYQSKQNWEKTAEHFVEFLDKVKNDSKAAEWIANATREGGLALARIGKFEEAAPLLEKAASAKPNDIEVHYRLGMGYYLTKGDEAKAEEHLTKVIQLQPDLDRPYYAVGHIAYNNDDFASAKEKLSKYLELSPEGEFAASSHLMLGMMATREAQGGNATARRTAQTHLNKYIELKPDSPQAAEAHYILGSFAAAIEDVETARVHFQKYLKLNPSGPQAKEIRAFLADLK